ncbi:alpha-1,2-mannosidase family protein [Metarhizium acridum CQMa 102]|uniref:Alpha-1,2-mannosidase family protein n=1 Tax=Metarhizium acridum (strain CQMa 102) TaxID=655827 RepID=E9ED28_METAQ|nr:alpha-1,2-mannosidase family protein [Metarhizium acridum CQMa 102]EFY86184.1 alpha-1,2-mannosidase family protein [Metarhizium acridum CQMa 102]
MNDTRAEKDLTEVRYYRPTLGSGTFVELYASRKAGLYRYGFPDTTAPKNVLVDASHVLSSYRGQGLEQHFVAGNISIVSTKKGNTDLKYMGWGAYDNVRIVGDPYANQLTPSHLRVGTELLPGPSTFAATSTVLSHTRSFWERTRLPTILSNSPTNLHHTSPTPPVSAPYSPSTTPASSLASACPSSPRTKRAVMSTRGFPQGSDGWELGKKTRDEWNVNGLGRITTPDTNVTKLTQLYTAMYFMYLLPTRKTGENPGWNSSEPYDDDIFTLWDTHRCTTALFHILQEDYYAEFIRSLIDTYRHTGWLPDGRSSFSNGAVQGGTNADNVLADAYVKGVAGTSPDRGINWEDAYKALLKNANTEPLNNHDLRDPTGSTAESKGALPDYSQLGYITPSSMNDFSLAVVAAGLGKDTFAANLNRSRNWRNHWNTNMTALNFTSFLAPPQYQRLPAPGYPLMRRLLLARRLLPGAAYMGGPERFVQRLEKTFEPGAYPGNRPFGNTIFNPGNEPSSTTPYLYHYAGRQDLAVRRSRHIAKSYYVPKPDGLPGNSDAGNMISLYPMTGTPLFLIGSPGFADLTIHLGGNAARKLRITSTGGETPFTCAR